MVNTAMPIQVNTGNTGDKSSIVCPLPNPLPEGEGAECRFINTAVYLICYKNIVSLEFVVIAGSRLCPHRQYRRKRLD